MGRNVFADADTAARLRRSPPGVGKPRAGQVRVELFALKPAEIEAAADRLRRIGGVTVVEFGDSAVEAQLFAAHQARELVTLLRWRDRRPGPAALLDLDGLVGVDVAALLGVSGYLHARSLPWQIRYCLRQIADGYAYAAEPYDGVFHQVRERGALTTEERAILSLLGAGYPHDFVMRKLCLSPPTLKRRIAVLRERLGLSRRDSLAVAAAWRLGLG